MQQAFSISGPLMSGSSASAMTSSFSGADRRRTIRIRRSSLLQAKLDQVDRPSIKIAETLDEYLQAFRLLHDVYLASGYLRQPHPSGLAFGAHHLLPRSCVFVFKTYMSVISTMSMFPDTDIFGLPMDELYKDELDALRDKGRRLAEAGSLATPSMRRWQNLMVFLAKALFGYCMSSEIDDLCIMINPKHVRFYQSIYLFEPLGAERYYPKVNAPAVAMRADLRTIEPSLAKAYGSSDFETDLHSFFVKVNSPFDGQGVVETAVKNSPLESEIARPLLEAMPEALTSLDAPRRAYLETMYHRALFAR